MDGKKIHNYIEEKFSDGYKAVGTEYNDGDGTNIITNRFIENFEDIPCCFGTFYDLDLARSESWIVSSEELSVNASNGFVEVGWRIRKKIIDYKIKTKNWKTNSTGYGDCFFKNEDDDIMGFHYVGGSHRRWSPSSYQEIKNIIDGDY